MWIYIWLAVLAVSLILEFITMELVSAWVAVGSFIAMILAIFNVQVEIQLAVFVVISIACILALRRVTLKLLNKNKGKTNLDVIVGTKHKLIKPITEEDMGTIKVNGVLWNVVSKNSELVNAGEFVEILEVEGNKFIVKKVSGKEEKKVNENKETEKTQEQKIEENKKEENNIIKEKKKNNSKNK